jgi:hypothetical protein
MSYFALFLCFSLFNLFYLLLYGKFAVLGVNLQFFVLFFCREYAVLIVK